MDSVADPFIVEEIREPEEDVPGDQHEQQTQRPRRTVRTTERGHGHFIDLCKSHHFRINKIWTILEKSIEKIDNTSDEIDALLRLHTEVTENVNNLESECTNFFQFLNRHDTDESNQEISHFTIIS